MKPSTLFEVEAWINRQFKPRPLPATPIVCFATREEKKAAKRRPSPSAPKEAPREAAPQPENGVSPAVRAIVRLVSDISDRSMADLCGNSRRSGVTPYRQIAMFLARRFTDRSLPVIGTEIGGRDHTTILHGIRLIERAIKAERIEPAEDTAEAWAEALVSHYRAVAHARAKAATANRTAYSKVLYWRYKDAGLPVRGKRK